MPSNLHESNRGILGTSAFMESKARILVPSGIEPVDRLLGGLEGGLLYLVRGDASSKSLFGIKFVLEGLRQGQNCALIIRYSPEDAVRRFSRLGYDCLDDVKEGRLIILEFGDDIVQQVVRLREISPVLRELGSLLGETHPERVVFDPITDLVVSEYGNVEPRIKEFSEWALTLGATSLLITNGISSDLAPSFLPVVRDSFRFDLKEEANRAHTYLTLEKRPNLSPQLVDVDPARGIFLERGRTTDPLANSGQNNGAGWQDIAAELLDSARTSESTPATAATPTTSASVTIARTEQPPSAAQHEDLNDWLDELVAWAIAPDEANNERARNQAPGVTGAQTKTSGGLPSAEAPSKSARPPVARPNKPGRAIDQPVGSLRAAVAQSSSAAATTPPAPPASVGGNRDETPTPQKPSAQSSSAGSSITASVGEAQTNPGAHSAARAAQPHAASSQKERETGAARQRTLDPGTAARTAEELLRPPDVAVAASHGAFSEPRVAEPAHTRARDFRVLVIEADPTSRDLLSRGIGEYSVETAEDAVTGLAKLGALKPDLVILDLDLPVVDGFKLLTHIRSTANMPIIVLSGLYVRSSDRIQSAELGADYYMTKPFSVKELRQKARQLIARHRGISDWISHQRSQRVPPPIVETGAGSPSAVAEQVSPASAAATRQSSAAAEKGPGEGSRMRFGRGRGTRSVVDQFLSYDDFVLRVEQNVKLGMEIGTTFSIVGCRMPDGANGTVNAVRLYGLISAIIRNDDLISMNQRNDFVVLLTDADAAGAKAFIGRLFDRVVGDMETEPLVWLRSFPHLEEATEVAWQTPVTTAAKPPSAPQESPAPRKTQPAGAATPEPPVRSEPARPKTSERLDPRESYINLLKNL